MLTKQYALEEVTYIRTENKVWVRGNTDKRSLVLMTS